MAGSELPGEEGSWEEPRRAVLGPGWDLQRDGEEAPRRVSRGAGDGGGVSPLKLRVEGRGSCDMQGVVLPRQ